ncbi:MAG: class I SAM-dependent methyltransferase [Deltaproteobacteria bacterium]|nr:class I SAM-dependent methyltransferase [Deltaproteobacteria bacterium]MBF0525014.1 class I SAM-dependent methyltransferase [Deltaproteobacteria bacterium]
MAETLRLLSFLGYEEMMNHIEFDNWEDHWNNYANSAETNPAQRYRHQLVVRLIKKHNDDNCIRILDIGSGQGDLCAALQESLPNSEVVGLELSAIGVRISQQKVPKVTFITADILDPPDVLDKYAEWATHAVCSEVLEHVDDPVLFLQRVKTYLEPDGYLFLTVPGGKMSSFDHHIGHIRHFTRNLIEEVLKAAGFHVETIYRAGFPFFNLYRLVVILRGRKLIEDVKSGNKGFWASLSTVTMKFFNMLFNFNLLGSPFGWQVIVVARKPGTCNH